MTANWEVFTRDPRAWQIPNQGVTKVGTPKDAGDWEVLKWELESFVCEGEYAAGLQRILSAYLARLSQAEQTAVWVSGFYGSGKSHLTQDARGTLDRPRTPIGTDCAGSRSAL